MAVVDACILKGTSCWIILREGLGGCVTTSVRADAREESSELQSLTNGIPPVELWSISERQALVHPPDVEALTAVNPHLTLFSFSSVTLPGKFTFDGVLFQQ